MCIHWILPSLLSQKWTPNFCYDKQYKEQPYSCISTNLCEIFLGVGCPGRRKCIYITCLTSSRLLYMPLCWELTGSWVPSGNVASEKGVGPIIWIGNPQFASWGNGQFLSSIPRVQRMLIYREKPEGDYREMEKWQDFTDRSGDAEAGCLVFWVPSFLSCFLSLSSTTYSSSFPTAKQFLLLWPNELLTQKG